MLLFLSYPFLFFVFFLESYYFNTNKEPEPGTGQTKPWVFSNSYKKGEFFSFFSEFYITIKKTLTIFLFQVVITEFVPMNYYSPPVPCQSILPESPESSSPSTLSTVPNTSQVHQVNNVATRTTIYFDC